MRSGNKQLILMDEDYKTMVSLLRHRQGKLLFDKENVEALELELQKALLVKREDFPLDVVRLNSIVKIKADGKGETIQLMLVTPDKADIKERKISVLAPIGTALIGFRKGEQVKWRVPAGKRTFTILEVINEP